MLRSYLFTPATTLGKLPKALASGADALILDLEDSVPLQEKAGARAALVETLREPPALPTYVRINALSTPFALDDLLEVGAVVPTGIMLPKVEAARDLHIVDWILAQVERRRGVPEGSIEILPIIETGRGVAAAGPIADAAKRVKRLMLGAVDLGLDMDLDLGAETGALAQARFAVALASRVAGLLPPLDTPFLDVRDPETLRISAINARATGFGGKACIHPAQVPIVNAVFTPSAAELEQARKVIAAFEKAEREGAAALVVDGAMVDYPVVERARRLLSGAPASRS
jgi:citrate lyase subunit beta/citryl-CoA lyase